LVSKKQDGLEAELAVAEIEKILERRTKKVQDHGVVVTFGSEPPDERDANTARKGLVDLGFIFKLRVLCLDGLELDGDLLS
jgi:hypothetical protein